ncbi:unnamed protein product [Miscanthus lutarioriparius]|uniref:Uncharacterized protein n=1 Tax=Miscanthus lutarioriparius TaxID=422564 RepID=A0A811RSL2_9POAL|nr:unnamed protein product [Miscanthus lutarioriparius]
MDDMDMAMALVAGMKDLDQVMLAMSPGSSATSSAPAAAAAPAATDGGSSKDDEPAADLRRDPWTVDEDILLVNYIAAHGEGRWNSLARSAGLKRTGKSCRLRWLNYLRPDVRQGNITAKEQLLILDLHSSWGNRWSKIAQHLPGRTDNEIKNYWRTRVQKHARHLRCDVKSASFRHVWMPRLRERIQADAGYGGIQAPPAAPLAVQVAPATTTASAPPACYNYYGSQHLVQQQGEAAASEADHHHHQYYSEPAGQMAATATALSPDDASSMLRPSSLKADDAPHYTGATYTSAASAATPSNDQSCRPTTTDDDNVFTGTTWSELLATATATATGGADNDSSSMSMIDLPDFGFGDLEDGLWSLDDLCLQQLC